MIRPIPPTGSRPGPNSPLNPLNLVPAFMATYDMNGVVDGQLEKIQPHVATCCSYICNRMIEECIAQVQAECAVTNRVITGRDIDDWWSRKRERPVDNITGEISPTGSTTQTTPAACTTMSAFQHRGGLVQAAMSNGAEHMSAAKE